MTAARLSEPQELQNFLANSSELKEMRKLALKCPPSICYLGDGHATKEEKSYPEQELVNEIEDAKSFADILKATERMDVAEKSVTDPTVRFLGQGGMSKLLYVGSFFYDSAGFAYYALQFRQKAIDKIAELGIRIEAPKPS